MPGAGSTRAPVAGPEELTVLAFVRPASPASPAKPSRPSHPQFESSSSRSTACAGAAVLGAPTPGEVVAVLLDCAIAAPPTARVAITDKTRVRCMEVAFRSCPGGATPQLATRFKATTFVLERSPCACDPRENRGEDLDAPCAGANDGSSLSLASFGSNRRALSPRLRGSIATQSETRCCNRALEGRNRGEMLELRM
jgi:hypothetical protein